MMVPVSHSWCSRKKFQAIEVIRKNEIVLREQET